MDAIIIGAVIGALVCAGIAAGIASNNSGKGGAGFVLGLLFGPIGIIIAALLKPDPQLVFTAGPQTPRQSPVPDLASAQYRVWLIETRGIVKNEVLGEFILGDRSYTDVEDALQVAHAEHVETLKKKAAAQAAAEAETAARREAARAQAVAAAAALELERQRRRDWVQRHRLQISVLVLALIGVLGIAVVEARARVKQAAAAAKARCDASRQAHPAGSEFSDTLSGGGKGPAMVVVPCGSFSMGSTESSNEQPVHPVSIAASFALAKYEVSFAEYDAFAKATGRSEPSDLGWGRGKRPVINVSWDDATAYAAWLSQQTGKKYRLPTEAEWEYAARAGSTTKYAWGDEVGVNKANCDGCGSQWDNTQTAPVGSFAANAFGLHDMHGNVWEWVQDCYHSSYQGAPADSGAREQCDSSYRVLRGGSWVYGPTRVRSADRADFTASYTYNYDGFRLAQDLE